MSTRAQICMKRDTPAFTDDTGGIYIYKHNDGYPGGVMPVLADLVPRFVKDRGSDASYLLCQVVRAFAARDIKSVNFNQFTGWGLDTIKHDDTEYLYEIDADSGKIYINGVLDSKDWSSK